MPFKSPEAVIRNRLVADAAVSALVGSRVYPVLAPATATLPLVTWRRSSISRQQTLAGPLGMPTVFLSMDVYAETYEAVRELADTVRKSLDGWGGTSQDGVRVANVTITNEADGFVTLAGGDVPPVYTVQLTIAVLWQEI
jgi:hypothetical protein